MHALEVRAFSLEALHIVARPTPTPRRGEILVRIKAATVNYRDLAILTESYMPALRLRFADVPASAAKRASAQLIKQVYEVDPLVYRHCAGAMRIIAVIEQPNVIKKILTHLGLWPTPAHSPPVAGHPLAWSLQRVALPRNLLTSS